MRLIILLLILGGVYYWQSGSSFSSFSNSFSELKAGRSAPDDPVQKRLSIPKNMQFKNFILSLHNSFEMKALVLSKKNYSMDAEAKLSPTDLALGWGAMSNPAPLRTIKITQGSRRYYFRYNSSPPISHRDIEIHSANMHIVPANDNVNNTLKKVKKGNVVHLKGYLIDAKRSDGWKWKSSRTRTDTKDGACELFFVEKISIIK